MSASRRGFMGGLVAGLLGLLGVGKGKPDGGELSVLSGALPFPSLADKMPAIPDGVLSVDAGWCPDWTNSDGQTVMERWAALRFKRESAVPCSLVMAADVYEYLTYLRIADRDLDGFGLIFVDYNRSLDGRDLVCRWRYVELRSW